MTKGEEALNKAYGHKGKTHAQIDCSHLVHKAFEAAGYKYEHKNTSRIPDCGFLRKLAWVTPKEEILFSSMDTWALLKAAS